LPKSTLLPGLLFALLWASASTATKFGVLSVPPFVLAVSRFFLAGGLMLAWAYGPQRGKYRLPHGREWGHLTLFALLNTAIYLGAFVLALQRVSAGIGTLAVATNPLLISVLSAVWLRRPLRRVEIGGLALGLAGVGLAAYPLLINAYASIEGLLILLLGMISVSAATVFYARINWQLPALVINGWQVLLGGVWLLPALLLFTDWHALTLDGRYWLSVGWLVGPVSIAAMLLWFRLLRQDPVRASLWLFLCPIFGFLYSSVLLGEPVTAWTVVGTVLVVSGLYLGRKS
jgi:probable blue pigment (indigoidine) exporter